MQDDDSKKPAANKRQKKTIETSVHHHHQPIWKTVASYLEFDDLVAVRATCKMCHAAALHQFKVRFSTLRAYKGEMDFRLRFGNNGRKEHNGGYEFALHKDWSQDIADWDGILNVAMGWGVLEEVIEEGDIQHVKDMLRNAGQLDHTSHPHRRLDRDEAEELEVKGKQLKWMRKVELTENLPISVALEKVCEIFHEMEQKNRDKFAMFEDDPFMKDLEKQQAHEIEKAKKDALSLLLACEGNEGIGFRMAFAKECKRYHDEEQLVVAFRLPCAKEIRVDFQISKHHNIYAFM